MAQTMMPMRKGTPTAGLEVILDLPPIDLRVKELALKALARVIPHNRTRWDGHGRNNSKGHLEWGRTELKQLDIDPFNNDSLTWYRNLQRGYNVDLDSFKSRLPISDCSTICYTDGSKMKSKTGFGLGITRQNDLIASKNGQLDQENSVFQAEIKAIQEACIILREVDTREVTIFSDSQSALLALSSILTKSEAVIDCISSLNQLSETAAVELKWVKAHADHTGNEFADMEAKAGTVNTAYKARVKRPLCSIKNAISVGMYSTWNQRWRSSTDCKQTKIWFPTINRKKSRNLVELRRNDLSLLTQIITGHNRFNRHESLVNHEVDATCRLCLEDEETSWHLVGECPALWYNREQVFGEKFLDLLDPEWTVAQMMSFAERVKLNQLNTRGDFRTP
jgi:ribonuclease HI